MKLYLMTIVRTDGYDDGTESNTGVYTTIDECIGNSFKTYESTWEDLFTNGEVTRKNGIMMDDNENERLSKEAYKEELNRSGYVLIQLNDFHIQFELSVHDLRPEMVVSELDPVVAEVEKLQEESLSINGDVVDADSILVD